MLCLRLRWLYVREMPAKWTSTCLQGALVRDQLVHDLLHGRGGAGPQPPVGARRRARHPRRQHGRPVRRRLDALLQALRRRAAQGEAALRTQVPGAE